MKKSSLCALALVLPLLLVGCNKTDAPDKKPGGGNIDFDTEPDITAPGDFKPNISFENKPTLKAKSDEFRQGKIDAEELLKYIDANQLFPTKIESTFKNVNVYDLDNNPETLNDENCTLETTYKIARDNEKLTKTGTFTKKGYDIISVPQTETTEAHLEKKTYDSQGNYSLTVDKKAFKINEKLEFTKPVDQEAITNVEALNDTTLLKAMCLTDLTVFKNKFTNFVKGKDSIDWQKAEWETSIDEENQEIAIKYVGESTFDKIDPTTNINEGVYKTEIYGVFITKDGWVRRAAHLYGTSPLTEFKIIQLESETYDFSL